MWSCLTPMWRGAGTFSSIICTRPPSQTTWACRVVWVVASARHAGLQRGRPREPGEHASIWLVQFLKAMRDERGGELLPGAHLLGFLRLLPPSPAPAGLPSTSVSSVLHRLKHWFWILVFVSCSHCPSSPTAI
ncbi:unnamed protein product [Closterium sp. Yama58-4]|nr:unnamed protein product [Closterium sp. Yama58-4]